MNIGQKIKEQRELLNLTQEELGKACGTTKQTIFKYETGIVTNIPMDRLCIIADKLRVTPSWLMGWDDNTPPSGTAAPLTPSEQDLLQSFRQLNEEGQSKLTDYADDLVASGRYIKSAQPQTLAQDA